MNYEEIKGRFEAKDETLTHEELMFFVKEFFKGVPVNILREFIKEHKLDHPELKSAA